MLYYAIHDEKKPRTEPHSSPGIIGLPRMTKRHAQFVCDAINEGLPLASPCWFAPLAIRTNKTNN
jgi:hypothetical protein